MLLSAAARLLSQEVGDVEQWLASPRRREVFAMQCFARSCNRSTPGALKNNERSMIVDLLRVGAVAGQTIERCSAAATRNFRTRSTEEEKPMNAYDRERAECAADEEARADRRLRAWRRRQMTTVAVVPAARFSSQRVHDDVTQLRTAV